MQKFSRAIPALLITLLLLLGCNKNSPNDVARSWLLSFYHMDYDAAKKLSTEDTKNFISLLQEFSPRISDSDKKAMRKTTVDIKEVKVNGDKANVVYTTSEMPGKEQPLLLVKQGNKWLVQFSKSAQIDQPDTSAHITLEPDTSAATNAPPPDDTTDDDGDK